MDTEFQQMGPSLFYGCRFSGARGVFVQWIQVSVWKSEKVLERDNGNGCPTMNGLQATNLDT